ncbi:MAG TPA: VWA domain-containing protein [Acidimicrobiia bacterium]
MLRGLVGFVEELRAVGVPVSMVEAIDAADALRHVDLADREAVKAGLGATLVKNAHHYAAFETAFEVFFGLAAPNDGDADETPPGSGPASSGAEGGGSGSDAEVEALVEAILAALQSGDDEALRALVRQAVDRLSGLEPGRPVGGRYYFYRVMRRLDGEALGRRLFDSLLQPGAVDTLAGRLAGDEAEQRLDRFRTELRREIIRRLVGDRGAEAVARTLRAPLVDDIDLMHATREELFRIERAVLPLARKLATRLAQRRRHGRKGRLDVRRTIRRSLAHGGALVEPRFRPPRRSKPELVLICDVSGSMATFARFTMQLTYAIGSQFSKVRAFAFIDGIDEVTRFFGTDRDFAGAMAAMSDEARLVWRDGHSDYGNALARFAQDYGDAVTPRTTVIVTGDARNNYRESSADVLASIADRCRSLYWVNPEARRYWDTGDSIMRAYQEACDGIYEVRTLRQLERFVERVALRTGPRLRSAVQAQP